MTRQYIGARYTTKVYENSLDPSSAEWESGVVYEPLTLVTYNNGSYLSKKEVPGSIGDPANNPLYWVVTGAYNGQITYLQMQIDRLKSKYYDIRDYGMQDGENIYDKLYDLLHDVVNPAGGGIVYFPKGTYTIDYTIFIPSNTYFVGDGVESNLVFDLTDPYFGACVCTAGSNCGISNMSVNIATDEPYNTSGSLPNAVGIGDIDYDAITGKRVHEQPRKAGNHNIILSDVFSLDSNYGLQCEPDTYPVKDIFVNNYQVPDGLFSVNPINALDSVINFFADNIVCDTLRISQGGNQGCKNVIIRNVYCTQMKVKSTGVTVDGFTLVSSQGNRITGAYEEGRAIVIAGADIKLANGHISKDNTSPATKLIQSLGDAVTGEAHIYLDNIYVEDMTAFTDGIELTAATSFYYSNTNFDPYAAYENLTTYSNLTSHWPVQVRYNANQNCSRIRGTLVYSGGSNKDSVCAHIGGSVAGTDLIKDAYCSAYLFKANDPSVPIEPCAVRLDPTDSYLYVYRLSATATTCDAVAFDLIW